MSTLRLQAALQGEGRQQAPQRADALEQRPQEVGVHRQHLPRPHTGQDDPRDVMTRVMKKLSPDDEKAPDGVRETLFRE